MKKTLLLSTSILAALALQPLAALAQQGSTANAGKPLIIAHRGASGYLPEHTIEGYKLAIEQGADFIEPDLVSTKDGVLVVRHEPMLSGTTDVADRPEFAGRKTTRKVDGVETTDWFANDFTAAEIKTLKAKQAFADRDQSHNGKYQIPTFQEVIDLAKSESARTGRTIGIYPETKHPSYFQSIGLALEPALLKLLADNGWNHAQAPVFVQSFEVENLRWIRARSSLRLVQLLAPKGKPYDSVARGTGPGYADMVTPAGLAEIARYANGIGPSKSMVIPVVQGANAAPTALVADAHRAGLLVHPWTLRPENAFLPLSLKSPPAQDGARRGNARADMDDFLRTGIDGIFTDDPSVGRAAIDALLKSRP